MCKVAVSLLEMDYRCLRQGLREIEKAGADYLHIDMMDGNFVPNLGVGIKLIQNIRSSTTLKFDVHMMVYEPLRLLERIARAGADMITVHYEACRDVRETVMKIKDFGLKAGVALNPETPLDVLDAELLGQVGAIHLMTTWPGIEGQTFIPESLDKIGTLCRKLEALRLSPDIEVDGNITKENVKQVVAAGATVIVSGRAIVQGNMDENIRYMKAVIRSEEKR